MTYTGIVPVTMWAECGWYDKTTIQYSVDCPSADDVRQTVECQWDKIAEAWHEQVGCEYGCVTSMEFHWDGDEDENPQTETP